VESGFKDVELYAWYGLFAPSATPEPIVARLNESMQKALRDPGILSKFDATGSSVFPPEQQTSAAAQSYFIAEIKRLVSVLRANSVVPE
jgi:tripartite-type tricarboxylate transporter receptor subunit TctC